MHTDLPAVANATIAVIRLEREPDPDDSLTVKTGGPRLRSGAPGVAREGHFPARVT